MLALGAAVLMPQGSTATPDALADVLQQWIASPSTLASMSVAARMVAPEGCDLARGSRAQEVAHAKA